MDFIDILINYFEETKSEIIKRKIRVNNKIKYIQMSCFYDLDYMLIDRLKFLNRILER